MPYDISIQYDPKTDSYCATVSRLPILVDAGNEQEALQMVCEAIEFYLEDCPAPTARARGASAR